MGARGQLEDNASFFKPPNRKAIDSPPFRKLLAPILPFIARGKPSVTYMIALRPDRLAESKIAIQTRVGPGD